CTLVIFTYTWLAVHPNIPAPDGAYCDILDWRQMVSTLLIAMTYKCTYAPCYHSLSTNAGLIILLRSIWTLAHGFFVQTGVFMLFGNGIPPRRHPLCNLQTLIDNGTIDLLEITEQEIEVKTTSHPNLSFFFKLWFIMQCNALHTEFRDR
ncbi:hypothetical protein BDQ12DRAFT_610073, partial [Crucibulum laeve]